MGLTTPFRTGTTHRKCHGEGHGDSHDSNQIIRWGLLYNLYADRLLGFNMFPQSVYEIRQFLLKGTVTTCLINNRNKMVFNQNQQFRNPAGQQVKSHRRSPTTDFRTNHPHDRSSDAKTGRHPFQTQMISLQIIHTFLHRLATLDSSNPDG